MSIMTQAQENNLIHRAKKGSREAFAELVQHVEARVYRVALQILRNQQDAEDAMQDGLLKAYEKLGSFNGASRFSTWATRIVINECLMRLRSRHNHSLTSIDEPVNDETEMGMDLRAWNENPEERFSRQQLQEILNQALDGLAEEYRMVVMLRDIEGLSSEEAAAELGISVAAVKSRLLRGRLALRQRLTRHFMRRQREIKQPFSLGNIFASLVPLRATAE